jgi:site-specific DNA-methyltransferase (adenine-specific)
LTDFIPVAMWVYLIRNSSQRGELVLDNGSADGGVLIACEQTGRVCRMIAKGVAEADIIRKRWAEFTYGEGCDWVSLTGEKK